MLEAPVPFTSAEQVLHHRTRWAIARLDELVQHGRAAGWIPGDPRAVAVTAVDLAAELEHRLALSTLGVAPLHWLAGRLALTSAELEALWLLVVIETSPSATRLAEALASTRDSEVTVQMLQQLVAISTRELDHLAQLALIELDADPRVPLPRRRVRVHDRVIDLARGDVDLDRELAEIAEVQLGEASGTTPPASLLAAYTAVPAPLIQTLGATGSGRLTLLAAVAASFGAGTLRVRWAQLDGEATRRRLRALLRESRLLGLVPVFRDLDAHPELVRALEAELRGFPGPVFATGRTRVETAARPTVALTLETLDLELRRTCWRVHLPALPPELRDAAAARYVLRPGEIAAVARAVDAAAPDDITLEAVHVGVREHLAAALQPVAERVVRHQTWDDLVIPPDQHNQLVELVARVRQRTKVLDDWGFRAKLAKGVGVAALLSGPPGTGKTMVASLVARELGLDLYQVDLSKIVSKYIGETEKQLAVLFDAAESGQAVVLFDEADALFAKRTEIRSSNDRYANLEVNYLLQRLEAFTGIALLTTNHEDALDPAFRRRLALHVRLPMPEEAEREQLWRTMLPSRAEVARDIDFGRLAHDFVMSGGYIRNATLRAAYLAADAGSPIAMDHLCYAARAEYDAMGKLTRAR